MFTIAFKDENSLKKGNIFLKDESQSMVLSYRRAKAKKDDNNVFDSIFIDNINPRRKYISGVTYERLVSCSITKNCNGKPMPKIYANLKYSSDWSWGLEFNLPDLTGRFIETILPPVRPKELFFAQLYGQAVVSPSILPFVASRPIP